MLADVLQRPQESLIVCLTTCGLSLPGLHLTGLRLMTTFAPDGTAQATARFLRAEGDPSAVLSPAMRGPAPGLAVVEDTALPVLQDLLCPALAIFDHILEHGLSEPDARVLAARLKTMRARRDELSDYIDLLTHVARDRSRRAATPATETPCSTCRADVFVPREISVRSVRWSPTHGTVRGEQASILHGHHDGAPRPG